MKQKTLLLFTAIITLIVMGMLVYAWLTQQPSFAVKTNVVSIKTATV